MNDTRERKVRTMTTIKMLAKLTLTIAVCSLMACSVVGILQIPAVIDAVYGD